MLKEKNGYIRSIDVAGRLGVTKPSVSYTTKRLREGGYLTMNHEGLISLTGSGMEITQRMCERHRLLSEYLRRLGVDEKTAGEEACKTEHDISEESFKAICLHAKGENQSRKKLCIHLSEFAENRRPPDFSGGSTIFAEMMR